MNKSPCVYILATGPRGTLYVGVTSDPVKRVYEHKQGLADGFTKEHKIHNLVYFEIHEEMISAIQREKQIKKWNRMWKIELIEKTNPDWNDLYLEIF